MKKMNGEFFEYSRICTRNSTEMSEQISDDPDIVHQIKPTYPQLQDLQTDATDISENAPIKPGETIQINYREPIFVTRTGTDRTYDTWNLENGKPIGEAWSLSEAAVRGLMRRYEWTRVEGEGWRLYAVSRVEES